MGDRAAAAADAGAIEKPSKRVSELLGVLAAGNVSAYDPASAWGGQMEVSIKCEGPAESCPIPIVVAPNGTVFSPYTPADARSGPRSVGITVVREGTYHVLVVGGAAAVKGTVAIRAADSSRSVDFARGGLQTVAAADVQVPPPWYGGLGLIGSYAW